MATKKPNLPYIVNSGGYVLLRQGGSIGQPPKMIGGPYVPSAPTGSLYGPRTPETGWQVGQPPSSIGTFANPKQGGPTQQSPSPLSDYKPLPSIPAASPETSLGSVPTAGVAPKSVLGGLSSIPTYKKGGIVKKTGLALVHKGEKVIPKSKVEKKWHGDSKGWSKRGTSDGHMLVGNKK